MENLGIDGKLLLAQLINFGIFFFLWQRFMAKPFMKFLHGERKNEEEKNKLLAELKVGEERLANEEKEMKKKSRKEANEELEKAKTDAQKMRDEIIAKAHKDAEAVVAQGKQQLEDEKAAMYKEVRQKAADIAVMLVEKSLQQYLTEDAKKHVTNNIVKNVNELTG